MNTKTMNNIKDKKIAIVGGGPGGLTLARLLQMLGADVNVYERDASRNARAQGATLDLHEESGLAALKEAGLMDAFNANYRPGADMMRVTDKHGTVMFDDHAKEIKDNRRPEIDRGPLQNILLDSLKPGTVVWDSHFAALTPANDGWNLEFKNGATTYADIVIGADGANSKIRPYLTPIKPFYSGLMIVEGHVHHSESETPRIHQLLKGGKIFAMGDEKTLIVSSKGDGSLVFYTSFITNENWSKESGIDFTDKAQVLEWFRKDYAGWDSIWYELFEHASLPFVPRPQYCMPLDQKWDILPNLTLLGDAAHVMPPSAGEGVNMAMQDALELARCLTNNTYKDTLDAIAAYEQEMLRRFAIVGKDTLEQTDLMHGKNGLENILMMFAQHP